MSSQPPRQAARDSRACQLNPVPRTLYSFNGLALALAATAAVDAFHLVRGLAERPKPRPADASSTHRTV